MQLEAKQASYSGIENQKLFHHFKDGKSVMVEVATGGDSGEQLPMVLKVPHLGSNPLKVCFLPFSMLGFGDILVPGLLLSYCHSFDLLVGTPYRLYWILTNTGRKANLRL